MISLFEAINVLARAEVEFIVIGGVAVRAHGSGYLTQDLDICYARHRSNLQKIADALRPLNPRPRNFPDSLPFVWDWTTLQNGTNFTFKTTLCDIDLLGEVPGIGAYGEVLAQSDTVDLEGQQVRILSVDGLITAKEKAGRPKDLPGLQELYALRDSESINED